MARLLILRAVQQDCTREWSDGFILMFKVLNVSNCRYGSNRPKRKRALCRFQVNSRVVLLKISKRWSPRFRLLRARLADNANVSLDSICANAFSQIREVAQLFANWTRVHLGDCSCFNLCGAEDAPPCLRSLISLAICAYPF